MSAMQTRVDGETAFNAAGATNLFDVNERPDVRSEASSRWSARFADRTAGRPAAHVPDDDSAHRDFLKRRDRLARIGRRNPKARLAAFLVALVHLNPDQGSGALVISETTDAHFVAGFLNLRLEDLTSLLLQFKSDGLVAPLPNGAMRITNLAVLEDIANGRSASKHARVDESFSEVHRVVVEPPRVYARYAAASAPLGHDDSAIRFEVVALTSAACLIVAFGIALGIIGL